MADRGTQSKDIAFLELLNACSKDGKGVTEALTARIINHGSYKEYKYLGLPDERALNSMRISQQLSFCKALELLPEADKLLQERLRKGELSRLLKQDRPCFTDYEGMKSFISILRNGSLLQTDESRNITNIERAYDFFDVNTIKSLEGFDLIDPSTLGEDMHENMKRILKSDKALYCISMKEYKEYIEKSSEKFRLEREMKASEKRLRLIKQSRWMRRILYILLCISIYYFYNRLFYPNRFYWASRTVRQESFWVLMGKFYLFILFFSALAGSLRHESYTIESTNAFAAIFICFTHWRPAVDRFGLDIIVYGFISYIVIIFSHQLLGRIIHNLLFCRFLCNDVRAAQLAPQGNNNSGNRAGNRR